VAAFFEWFRWLYDTTGINLTVFYDPFDRRRFIGGFVTTVSLAATCIVLSVAIGVIGARLQGSRLRMTRQHLLAGHPPWPRTSMRAHDEPPRLAVAPGVRGEAKRG